MNGESFKVIAEFVDKASPGLRQLVGLFTEFTKGAIEGAAAELKLAEANRQLAESAKKASTPMSELEDKLKKLALSYLAVTQVVNGFVQAITEADKLDDMSEKTGIAAGNLRELSYAAKIGGTSLDSLIGAMDKLGRAADKSDEEATKQAATFKQLGVSASNADGSLKSSEQLMLDLADAFAGIKDGPEKSAAAFRLFGSEAKNLLPLLSKGSDEFKRLREESAQLSGVSADKFNDFAKASGDLFDNIDKLGQVFGGLFTTLSAELVPVLNVFAELIISSAKEGGLLRDVMNGLGAVFSNIVVPGLKLAAIALNGFFSTLKVVGKGIGALGAALVAVFNGDFAGAKQIMSDFGDDAAKVGQDVADFQTKLALAGHEAVKLADNTEKPQRTLSSLKGKVKEVKSELQGMVEALRIANGSFGMDESTKQALEAQLKYAKDIKAGISPKRATALLEEAKALIELNRVLREAQAGQEAFDASQVQVSEIEAQAEAYRYEATLIGVAADERERLIQKFKEEVELRKIVDGLSETDAARVAEQFRRASAARAEAKAAADETKVANEMYDQSLEAAQKNYEKRVYALYTLAEQGKISTQEMTRLQEEEYDKLLAKTKKTTDEATVFWQEAAKGIQNSLQTFFFDFMQGRMGNLLVSFKRVIDQMVSNALAAKLGEALFGGNFQKNGDLGGLAGSAVSAISGFFGGFRENGGSVNAGQAYVVGEKRPELFIPKTSGMIVPSTAGIGGANTNMTISITALDSKSVIDALDEVSRKASRILGGANTKYNLGVR